MQFSLRKSLAAVMFFMIIIEATGLQAATKIWMGGINVSDDAGPKFDWSVGSNWSGGTAPVNGDDIVFNVQGMVIFDHLPASASYSSLYINQSLVSFRPYDGPSTFTIGNTADAFTPDLFIASRKDLSLGHDWGLTFNLILVPGAKATINGRLYIYHASSYNTDAAGTVTTVVNYDPVSGPGHFDGRIENYGACISNTSQHLIFSGNTRYTHINNNPTSNPLWPFNNNHTVPAATWDPTSTCWIQWFSPTVNPFVPANLHQAFGNFIWEVAQNTNLSVADTLTTINGNFTVNNTGGYNLQLTKASSAPLNIGGSLTIAATPTFPAKVSVDGGIVNIAGTMQLKTNTKSGFFMHSGGTINISDGLIINTGCSYTCINAPIINLQGNLVNNGSYITANETVICNGTSIQYIGGSKSTTFKKLTIANSAGVTLQTNAEVTGILAFINGKLSTSGTNTRMILGTNASITGAGADKYVNGNLGIRIPVNTVTKTYDIGDDLFYTPVTLAFSGTATNGTGMIVAKSTPGDQPNILNTGTFGIDPAKSVNRYYTLTNSGVTFGAYTATFTFNAADLDAGTDPLIFMVQRFVPNSWYPTTTGTRTATTTQFTGGSQTAFGDFQIGQMRCSIPSPAITMTGVESNCEGRSVAIGLSGSEAGVNYQLKRNGVNTLQPVSGGGSTISFGTQTLGGTYTVLATRVLGGCYSTLSSSVTFTP